MRTAEPFRKELSHLWRQIKSRCQNVRDKDYCDYGARGIFMCAEWVASFDAFKCWMLAAGWAPGLQIDRRDNDGPYSPDNCRIVTPSQNQWNRPKRRNREYTSKFKGVALNKHNGTWRACIRQNGRTVQLGTFVSEDAAARAFDARAMSISGEFASLNFPGEQSKTLAMVEAGLGRTKRKAVMPGSLVDRMARAIEVTSCLYGSATSGESRRELIKHVQCSKSAARHAFSVLKQRGVVSVLCTRRCLATGRVVEAVVPVA